MDINERYKRSMDSIGRQFLGYEHSMAIRDLGYDGPCLAGYTGEGVLERCPGDYWDRRLLTIIQEGTTTDLVVLAPLKSQFYDWAREVHLTDCLVERRWWRGEYTYSWDIIHEYGIDEERHFGRGYATYEEAERACIDMMLEIIGKKKKKTAPELRYRDGRPMRKHDSPKLRAIEMENELEEAAENYSLELLEAKTIEPHEKTWIKSMFIYIAKSQQKKDLQTEISDDEIARAARDCTYEDLDISAGSFELGARWYRERLKKKQCHQETKQKN